MTYICKVSVHMSENTVHINYKDHQVTVVYGNNVYLV